MGESTTHAAGLRILILQEPPPADLLQVAPGLAEGLLAAGWREGLPPQVRAATFALDARAYRRTRCPECGARRMRVRPMHRQGRYKLVLACGCGAETEV